MEMFRLTVVVCLLMAAVHGCKWGSSEECNTETNCSYGCHDGYCWSQCIGACTMTVFKGQKASERAGHCVDCALKEWCWSSSTEDRLEYSRCGSHEDCQTENKNPCKSTCTI